MSNGVSSDSVSFWMGSAGTAAGERHAVWLTSSALQREKATCTENIEYPTSNAARPRPLWQSSDLMFDKCLVLGSSFGGCTDIAPRRPKAYLP